MGGWCAGPDGVKSLGGGIVMEAPRMLNRSLAVDVRAAALGRAEALLPGLAVAGRVVATGCDAGEPRHGQEIDARHD